MKNMIRQFLGRQMARFQFSKNYLLAFVAGLTALSTTATWLEIPREWFFPLVITGTVLMFLVGYLLDKSGIVESDIEQTVKQQVEGSKLINKVVWETVIAPIQKEQLIVPLIEEIRLLRQELERTRKNK